MDNCWLGLESGENSGGCEEGEVEETDVEGLVVRVKDFDSDRRWMVLGCYRRDSDPSPRQSWL